jgi:hypothetical protein
MSTENDLAVRIFLSSIGCAIFPILLAIILIAFAVGWAVKGQ